MFYYSWSQIQTSPNETRLMEMIAITPVILIGPALLFAFAGLHLLPSFRTSKSLRRVTYTIGLAFAGWVCVITLYQLHFTIESMAKTVWTQMDLELSHPYTNLDFHKFYLGAFAILTATFGTAMLYWHIVKRRVLEARLTSCP